jgi:molecular chaperone DnaJ
LRNRSSKADYYDTLGVSRDASNDDIRKSYRRLARQYHPDVNKDGEAEERFKEINEAYEVLNDSQKRAAYDRFGHAGVGNGGMGADPFDGFGFGGFSDIFETFFGGTATRPGTRRGPQRGADLRFNLSLTFEEAVFGCDKEIEVTRLETCGACSGTGAEPGTDPKVCASCGGTGEIRRIQNSIFGQFVNVVTCDRCGGEGRVIAVPCRDCQGSGRMKVTRNISVTIPAGVDNDSQIRLPGQGEAGPRGGPSGNLYVGISIQPHKFLRRKGNDILLELQLNFAQAALGDEIEVPTVDGDPTPIKIASGTQSGKVVRIKERGVPYLQRSGRGDMLLELKIITPTHLTDEQRDLFHKLAKSLGKEIVAQNEKGLFGKMKDAFGV